ncbi:hypothetical protein OAS39_07930 [Pirellulales bacterium]|nr:hypothetical protein [Pirellulales bacterium]
MNTPLATHTAEVPSKRVAIRSDGAELSQAEHAGAFLSELNAFIELEGDELTRLNLLALRVAFREQVQRIVAKWSHPNRLVQVQD